MAIITINNKAINRSDTASSGQNWTATSATASDFQTAAAGGKIGQVISVSKTDTFSVNSSSYVDITGLTVNITPSASNSKILVLYNISGGTDYHSFTRLLRGSTAISVGDASSSRTRATTGNFYQNSSASMTYTYGINFLDSPSSTSQLTYKAQILAGGTTYVNRSKGDTDAYHGSRLASTITVMEVLA